MVRGILLTSLALVLAAGLLPYLRNAEKEPLTDPARAQAPGRLLALGHGLVHFTLSGPDNGPVVVFVHGFSVPSYTWRNNTRPLADAGYRVLSFDLYGRGYSDRPLTAYDRSLFTSQLKDLLDKRGLRGPLPASVGRLGHEVFRRTVRTSARGAGS